ncbi:hypothetical protein D3C87_1817360 [compost metagenome]
MGKALTAALPFLQGVKQVPIGYLFQHEETGLTQVVDVQQVEWGFEKNNPRWQKISPVYSAPVLEPSPRAQALESTDEMLNAGQERLCQLSASTNFNDYEQAEIFKAMFEVSGFSALSSQPVAVKGEN